MSHPHDRNTACFLLSIFLKIIFFIIIMHVFMMLIHDAYIYIYINIVGERELIKREKMVTLIGYMSRPYALSLSLSLNSHTNSKTIYTGSWHSRLGVDKDFTFLSFHPRKSMSYGLSLLYFALPCQ